MGSTSRLSCESYEVDEKSMTDLHLGNALNLDHVEALLEDKFTRYNIFIPSYQRKKWMRLMSFANSSRCKTVGLLLPTQKMLMHPSRDRKIREKLYKELTNIIGSSLERKGFNFPLVSTYKKICQYNVVCNELYMYCFRFLTQMVCMVSEAVRGGRETHYPNIKIHGEDVMGVFHYNKIKWRIHMNDSFCFLRDEVTDEVYAGNFDSILLIMDTLGQRICMDIGNQICEIGGVPGFCDRELLRELIAVGDRVLLQSGNNGYNFISMYEALLVSSILRKNPDQVTNSEEFYNCCCSEIEEMAEKGELDQSVVGMFTGMSDILIQLENPMLSNMFCLYRAWGHPRVDIYEGMKKVYTIGTESKQLPDSMANLVLCQFRKLFLIEFYTKNHKYPPCVILYGAPSYVINCIRMDLPISVDNGGYIIYDFQRVIISKLWELPETYDVCHILNDKAVSPNRSELYKSIEDGKGTVLGAQRRGIVRWLTGQSIRCKKFLEEIDENGLDEDSCIIGMYEKEREIKIKARMFSLMSERMRMYFVLTEEMISNHILDYFPQITMKDALHIQVKKLWGISGLSSSNSLDPTINIDFEKWNLNMRDEFTRPLFQQLDGMFGYKDLISRTHEIFEKSLIYPSSGTYLPYISDGRILLDPPMCYTGHLGGFEGLRQKGWTLATICLLSYIADQSKINVRLLGQGDNQVVRILMPRVYWDNIRLNQEQRVIQARKILEGFTKNMVAYFSEAGLPIKTRETWKSTRLFMYGKTMFLDGYSLPQWMKKLLRSYALSNEGTLTISGVIGTIATNLCAAAHASECPDILYVVFLILGEWSLEYLFAYHPFTRKSLTTGSTITFTIPGLHGRQSYNSGQIDIDRLITTILLIPTAVGGSVTIPLTGFIIRGFPDNASEGYSWLKLLSSTGSRFQAMFEQWYTFLKNETIEPDMIVQSPWSLNHKKPPTPGLQSRETVREWLLSGDFDQNTIIGNMAVALEGFDRKTVCAGFMGGSINPLILNEIYNSFPHVYLDQVMRRIENTRTIRKLAMKKLDRVPIISRLINIEHEFLGYLHWRGFQEGEVFSTCATKHCRVARNKGWECIVKGLTTPHPLEYCADMICTVEEKVCDGTDFVYCRIDQFGSFPPYLGSKVKTKVVSLQDIALRHEPLVTTSAKLLRYSKWLNLGPFAKQLINTNIQVTCDVNMFAHVDDSDESSYSGCVEHRFNPACASEGCFINYAPQVGKKVFLSSDEMKKYGRGNANYTLHFQALYSFIQYNAAHTCGTQFQHYHLQCEDCIVEVDDEVDDISYFGDYLEFLYTDRSVQVLRDALGYLNKRVQGFDDMFPQEASRFLSITPQEINIKRLKRGTHHALALRCAMMILYTKHDVDSFLGDGDLQTFPRVYGYKVSSVYILELVVEFLFLIKLMRSEELPSTRGFEDVRLRLYYQIMKSPVDRFKGLASLCVGRTWDKKNKESPLFLNFGDFPEDPTSFSTAVKSEVVDRLREFQGIVKRPSYIQIPNVGMSKKEEAYILLHRLFKTETCLDCVDQVWKAFKLKEVPFDCPHSHINQSCGSIKTVPLPMDSAVKNMTILPNTLNPLPISGLNVCEELNLIMFNCPIPLCIQPQNMYGLQQCVEIIKSSQEILLPSSIVYKWDFMMSHIANYQFDNVLIFGDRTGQVSAVCARRFPDSSIFPTSLLNRRQLIPQDMMSMQPFISRKYSNVSSLLLQNVPDDILDPLWSFHIHKFLSELQGNILIVSDLDEKDGNARLIKVLYNEVKDAGEYISIGYIHKVYFHEVYSSDDFAYVNPYCNANILEGFISNINLSGKLVGSEDAFSLETWTNFAIDPSVLASTRIKDSDHDDLRELSQKISWSCFIRNYMPVSKEFLFQPRHTLMYHIMEHISANFKAPYELRLRTDQRKLLDGMLIQMIKGVKMVLGVLYGDEVLKVEDIRRLTIAKVPAKHRIKEVRSLQACLLRGEEEHNLEEKEMKAMQQMRLLYLQYATAQVQPELPKVLEDIYQNLIIPGYYSQMKYRLIR